LVNARDFRQGEYQPLIRRNLKLANTFHN
jgi:hypothetical protein